MFKSALFCFAFLFSIAKAQMFIPHTYWSCQNTFTTESASVAADFNLGTYSNTNISGNSVVLSVGQTTGTYTSKVYDIFGGCSPLMPWLKLNWVTSLPYGKELPVSSEVSTDYSGIAAGLTTSLVGYWKLNETSGTTFTDSSGTTNTGNKQGTIVLGQTGKLLNAASFDGSSGYVSTTNSFNNPNLFTLSIWFKTTTTTGGRLIGLGNTQVGSSGNYDRHLYMNNAGQIYLGVYPNAVKTVNSTSSYNDGNWHHAVGTLSASGLQLYIDGALISTDASTTTAQNYTGWIHIGWDNNNGWTSQPSSFFFRGLLDEAAFWTRALSATEVQQVYRRGANRIKFQVKSCTLFDCSDTVTWTGPDNTAATYFTEINNNGTQSTGLGNVLATSPSMLFSNFPSLSIPTNRFFQYQATFETDNTAYVPDLTSTTIFRGCQTGSTTISSSGTWQLPAGCTSFTVTAKGGGGASARQVSGTRAVGGAGGQAVKSFSGQPANSVYTVTIGAGGSCSQTGGAGAYAGGAGGTSNACTVGSAGAGTGTGGTGGAKAGQGCVGGVGKYGGGGGGGGASGGFLGAGGGGATSVTLSGVDYVVAGGGGGSGVGDQGTSGTGGSACSLSSGYNGGNGGNGSGGDAAGGGGGGGCYCSGGTCNSNPTTGGGAGGAATGSPCSASNDGTAGSITIVWP